MLDLALICSIAGYDDPPICDITQSPPRVNPKYPKLTLIAGQDLRLGVPENDVVVTATTLQQGDLQAITDDLDAAVVEVSKRGFDYPSLKQIMTDRTCQGLGSAGEYVSMQMCANADD